MKRNLTAFLTLLLASSLLSAQAQSGSASKSAAVPHKKTTKKSITKKPAGPTIEAQIQELRREMQQQITDLKQQITTRDAQLEQAQQAAVAAQATATEAAAKADNASSSLSQNTQAVSSLQGAVTDLKSNNVSLIQTVQDGQKQMKDAIDTPAVLRYKGVSITPVAFFAAESVYRTRSLNSDINTPFNTVPLPGAAQANTSEFNASGRQSRLGALMEAKLANVKIGGYFESDFLGTGIASNNVQSNSYVLRQRQIWAQAAFASGFTLTGGQMWSLVTETKKSTDNRTENLPQTIDPQYQVGFSWLRQYGVRLQQTLAGNKLTLAASIEGAQGLYSAQNAPANLFIGNAGASGGQLNATANYTNNVAPDVVIKAAFDPGYGHYEVVGLGRFFRDRYYPNQGAKPASAAGAVNDTKVGGGVAFNARFPITKRLDIGFHGLTGTGVGRYGTTALPDFTVHPNGSLEPLRASQALLSIEPHVTPKLDVYAYAGMEYVQRTTYLNSAGKLVGYAPVTLNNAGCSTETLPTSGGNGFAGGAPYDPGTPANCQAVTRTMFEGTLGYWYRFYNGPKGSFRYGLQYSYLQRAVWAGIGGAPKGTDNMVFTSVRYYLP